MSDDHECEQCVVRLEDAAPVIVDAIRWMLECDEEARPFVIAESGDMFVQWCTTPPGEPGELGARLLFDVPALRIVARPAGPLAAAAAEGVAMLRELGLDDGAEVTVKRGTTNGGGGRRFAWWAWRAATA